MTAKTIVLIALLTAMLGAPSMVDTTYAAAIPGYFADEWVGFLCIFGPVPTSGNPARVNILFQLNFDKSVNGGITLARADQLFAFFQSQIVGLGTAGVFNQQTCALTPSQVQSQYGANALQAAQQVSGSFQQLGFQLYFINDSFWGLVPNYLGLPSDTLVLRTDVFLVNGSDNVNYTRSLEILEDLVP